MDTQVFHQLFRQFATCFPSCLLNGRVPAPIEAAYANVLGHLKPDILARSFKQLTKQNLHHLPAAGIILATASSIEKNYKGASEPNANDPPPKQMQAFTGDGLPATSHDIPPAPGRRASDYSYEAHDKTNYFLDMLRAMKLKGLPGGEMADSIMQAMKEEGPKRRRPQGPYDERVRLGYIPGAANATCAAFADYLDDVRAKRRSLKEDPADIGGRLFWTFSGRQQAFIRQAIGKLGTRNISAGQQELRQG